MASAGFLAVTGRNDAPTCVLAHIVTPSSVSYYLSSAPYVSGDSAEGEDAPTNTAYTPIISGFPRVRIGIDDFLSGQASVSWGELVLATDENVAAMFGTPGASITLFVAVAPQHRGLSIATAKFPSSAWRECVLIGKVSHFRTNQNRTVSITIQSLTREIYDKPIASQFFNTTDTPTLPTENIGKRRPYVDGKCRNITPTLVDASLFKFQHSTASDNTATLKVFDGGLNLVTTGAVTAYDADATKIHLAASLSSDAGYYNTCKVRILSGTGAGQERSVYLYDGNTKIATLSAAWTTNPDTTSVYELDLWHEVLIGSPRTTVLLSRYVYNITFDVESNVSGFSPFVRIWYSVLGKSFESMSDSSGITNADYGIFIDDDTTVGGALSMLARACGCVWATIPTMVSGVPTDTLVIKKLEIPTGTAAATLDGSNIIAYDLALDTDVIWRATGHDKKTWTRTEQNAANSQLPIADREWLKAGYVRNVYENTSASTRYGAREIEVETLRYNSAASTATLTQLVTFFSGAIRKRLRTTVPAFFPSPVLMDKITVTLPDNVATYSGDYALAGWTTYTDSNGTVLMDLELFG